MTNMKKYFLFGIVACVVLIIGVVPFGLLESILNPQMWSNRDCEKKFSNLSLLLPYKFDKIESFEDVKKLMNGEDTSKYICNEGHYIFLKYHDKNAEKPSKIIVHFHNKYNVFMTGDDVGLCYLDFESLMEYHPDIALFFMNKEAFDKIRKTPLRRSVDLKDQGQTPGDPQPPSQAQLPAPVGSP